MTLLYEFFCNSYALCSRRTNVALTRARRHMFIVGKVKILQQSDLWRAVVNHCRGFQLRQTTLQASVLLDKGNGVTNLSDLTAVLSSGLVEPSTTLKRSRQGHSLIDNFEQPGSDDVDSNSSANEMEVVSKKPKFC